MPAPLPPPGCVCFPATCICKYRVCEHVSLSRRARLRPRIHRGMKREKGRERSILLPARDETKGKLTSAQWFSLLSRNCFQTFVSYRWKRRTMWKETFSFFFFSFFLRRGWRRKGKGSEQPIANSFFPNRVPLKLDPRRKNFNLALSSEKEDSSSSFLFFDVFADRKTRSK